MTVLSFSFPVKWLTHHSRWWARRYRNIHHANLCIYSIAAILIASFWCEMHVFGGISSNGRAPASHAGSTGIDTRILQDQDFWDPPFLSFLSFSFPFAGICFSFICYKMPVVCHDFQHKTTVFQSLCYLLEQNYLSVHSLSPSAEEAYISWCTFKLRTFNFTLYVKFSDTLNLAQLGPWFAWRKWSCCCRFQ